MKRAFFTATHWTKIRTYSNSLQGHNCLVVSSVQKVVRQSRFFSILEHSYMCVTPEICPDEFGELVESEAQHASYSPQLIAPMTLKFSFCFLTTRLHLLPQC